VPRPKSKISRVDKWLKRESIRKREALENAARHFDSSDSLSVSTLEGIYSQESSFGSQRGTRGSAGPAGDFQIDKRTATRLGLSTSKANDQRFSIDDASAAAAKHLKTLDESFRNETVLSSSLKTIPIANSVGRKKFVLAAYNAGEGRIAEAQELAKEAGKDPQNWDDVKNYLTAAGASAKKSKETQDYVDNISQYESEFARKSKADKSTKGKSKALKNPPQGGHWITKSGRHIFIKDK
jgi:membrane-bound lytic murein transglycosylase MltF